jgi:hypothetical protein
MPRRWASRAGWCAAKFGNEATSIMKQGNTVGEQKAVSA